MYAQSSQLFVGLSVLCHFLCGVVFHVSSVCGCSRVGELVGLSSRSGGCLFWELFACGFVVTVFALFSVN